MTNLNVRKGDNVVVITGKDAGKKGVVLATNPSKGRIIVEGVNIVTKHKKAKSASEQSTIVKKEGTIDVSNVMVICPVCGKTTRIKHALVNGKKARVCKCGSSLDVIAVPAKAEKKAAKKAVTAESSVKEEKVAPAKKAPAKKTAEKTIKATSVNTKATKIVAQVKKDV